MPNRTLSRILADNLAFFMGRKNCPYPTANSLAVAAGVSPNSVRNLLEPKKRTVTSDKPDGYPQLDTVAKCALKLNVQVWELFHPDIEQSIRERQMYEQIKSTFPPKSEAPKRVSRNPALVR